MHLDPNKGVLVLDFETSSGLDIKAGSWPYSQHESTIVLCAVFCYATPCGTREYFPWTPRGGRHREVNPKVLDFVRAGGLVVAHNYFFEHSIWTNICVPYHGWPEIELEQWRDTQVLSRAVAFPPSLEGVGLVNKLPMKKDKEGAKLMLEMAVALPDECGGWLYPRSRSHKAMRRLLRYCKIDVDVTADAYFRLPQLPVIDALGWLTDKRINERGVFLDVAFAAKCARLVEQRKDTLADETFRLTAGDLDKSTNHVAIKPWLKAHGVELPTVTRQKKDGSFTRTESADKAACAAILKTLEEDTAKWGDEETRALVRAVLTNRQEANKAASLSKLARVPHIVGHDGRLRGALAFSGASTGRWTSYGLQLHNLPKNKMRPQQTRLATLCCHLEDLEMLEFVEDRPLEAISNLLRSVIRAAPGHELIAADYSAIEARVLAWLAGQDDVVAQFAAGKDVYVYQAESIGAYEILDPDTARQLGKICVLALGFGMGILKFHVETVKWGLALPLTYTRDVQKSYRESNAHIVQFWRELEDAFRTALDTPDTAVYVGPQRLCVSYNGACVKIRLPSGRSLHYWRPRIATVQKTFETVDENGVIVKSTRKMEEIQFYSVGQDKVRMSKESTYGGKLAENVTQAVARDLLASALPSIDRTEPYRVVMHVHDSIAAEVPAGAGDVDEFCALMAAKPAWARGLPLAVEGYRDVRFRG